MSPRCETCGQIVPTIEGVRVDEVRGTVETAIGACRLSPNQMRLFLLLLARPGRPVKHAALWQELYFTVGEKKEADPEVIKVMIHRMRAALRPLGLSIVNIWSVGYALEAQRTEGAAA